MMRTIAIYLQLPLAALALSSILPPQPQDTQQKTSFYDVQLTKDEIYTYADLQFKGDYTSFESKSGIIALGRTEAGVTVAIVLGTGTVNIEAPEAGQAKFKTIFGAYPLKTSFKSIYIRIHPKEFDSTLGKITLTKTGDEAALAKAKELFDLKFLGSYHAGPRAILPPEKTRVFDFDTDEFGQLHNEEGYWLRLRRISPYGSVYPTGYVNPKQRYAS